MGLIKLIIVEDEPLIAEDLSNQLKKADFHVIQLFESGQEIIDHLKDGEAPDLILMDINLYGPLDGVDTAHVIHNNHDIPIIFLTSNTDSTTFKRAKSSLPFAFLSKPFRINDVIHAIELAVETKNNEVDDSLQFTDDRIFIKTINALERVSYDEILFLEADGAYTKMITDSSTLTLSQTLKKTEAKIEAANFVKIHRSYVVNINNVERVSDGYVFIKEHKLPMSRAYREPFLRMFKTI